MVKSLGLIETIGLTAGIEAADAAVKSANVELIGYELAKGSGMTTIKVEGDVGAVKAAVDAASDAASRIGTVVSAHVIARPAQGLDRMTRSKETVGYQEPEKKPVVKEGKTPKADLEEPVKIPAKKTSAKKAKSK